MSEEVKKDLCLHEQYVSQEMAKDRHGFISYHLLRMVDFCSRCGADIKNIKLLK